MTIATLDLGDFLEDVETDPIEIITLDEVNRAIDSLLPDDTEDLRDKVRRVVPAIYNDYADVFSKVVSDRLADRRAYDHAIDLEEGKKPEDLGYSALYKMSLRELETCREYITDNLRKGFIESSLAL